MLVQTVYGVAELSAPVELLDLLDCSLLGIETVPVPYKRTCVHHKHAWLGLIVFVDKIVEATSFRITTSELVFVRESFA